MPPLRRRPPGKWNPWPLIGVVTAVGAWVLVVAFCAGLRTLVRWAFP